MANYIILTEDQGREYGKIKTINAICAITNKDTTRAILKFDGSVPSELNSYTVYNESEINTMVSNADNKWAKI